MFKKLSMTIITVFTVLMMSFSIVACSRVEFEINFVVDSETYAVVTTSGNETISMPANPTKEGYTFEGWYLDEGVWTQPFTANLLLDASLSRDISIYAKFISIEPTVGLAYELSTDGTYYTLTGIGSAIDTDIVIPSTYNDKPVKSIGNRAFVGCALLKNIVIPDSVTSIGEVAFHGCSGLTSIVIPDSVTSIESGAFAYCDSLTSIVIPDSVTSIESGAFAYCYSLTSIVIPNSVTSIGSSAFYWCYSLTSVVIGDSVTSIGEYAFSRCYKLVEVYNKSTLNITEGSSNYGSVGYYALNLYTQEGGSKLSTDSNGDIIYTDGNDKILVGYNGVESNLILPDEITAINSYAFYNCDSLTSIVIPDSVTSIGSSAFSGCSKLESITLPFVGAKAGVTSVDKYQYPFGYIFGTSSYSGGESTTQYYRYDRISITNTTYYIPSSLKSVTITGGNILYGAFYYCRSLTSIVIGDRVTSIGESAFYYCRSLTSIVIPNSVTSIGKEAFYECSPLTSVVIGDSVTSIGSDAFYNCSSLTSIVIPDSVTSIGDRAFYNCSSLTSVVIGDSVTSIGDRAFYNCSSLTSVVIGDNVTSIGTDAFEKCSSLTSVEIPDSVTSIGYGAFSGCSNLTYNVKDGLKYLGNRSNPYLYLAGIESANITKATIDSSCKIIGYDAFYKCSSLTSIVIPDSVTSIGIYAFHKCSSLTSIVIPVSVKSIGNGMFYDCSSLTSIKYRGTSSQWSAISKGFDWSHNTGNYTITYNYTGE